jgi:uncharacterized cupredoxin-like copper-binding protein
METNQMLKSWKTAIGITTLVGGLAPATVLAAGSHTGGHHHFEFGAPGKAAEVSRSLNVVMRDNYFEPELIKVKAGETIRFVIRNQGELVHEFNLGTPHMHAEHQKEMLTMVEHGVLESDRINHEKMHRDMGGGMTMAHDDPNSVLLEPGAEAEIIWRFAASSELEFACNVPGHYESGMAGSIEFVEKLASRQ